MKVRRMTPSSTDYDRFSESVHCGRLQSVCYQYAMGMRTTTILDELARLKVYADNSGVGVPCFVHDMDNTAWNEVLDKLVADRLGDKYCLDCGEFFNEQATLRPLCTYCGSTLTESINCVNTNVEE